MSSCTPVSVLVLVFISVHIGLLACWLAGLLRLVGAAGAVVWARRARGSERPAPWRTQTPRVLRHLQTRTPTVLRRLHERAIKTGRLRWQILQFRRRVVKMLQATPIMRVSYAKGISTPHASSASYACGR